MTNYIAAGFDPARFWELTPRLYVMEMEGAAARSRNERALVWWGGMMSRLEKPPSFDDFVGGKRKAERQTPEVLQAMLEALAASWGAEMRH